jgi:mannose-6-phosphate isomerase-like protein (cupin superfamily)
MQIKALDFHTDFDVVAGNARAQAAVMVIAPGDSEGGPDNRHRGADQWLYVVDGTGEAILGGRHHALKSGVLLLIEKGEQHEIRNTGTTPLQTLNFYTPPAYDPDGEPLPAGES